MRVALNVEQLLHRPPGGIGRYTAELARLLPAARRADVVIAPTMAAAEEISSRTPIPRERIRVIPHGVTQLPVGEGVVAATRATLGVGQQPYVLWVGTLEPRKNLPVLIKAFR